jgi:SAM-dependent methyltransferase
MNDHFVRQSAEYYAAKLKAHGPGHRAVDWNSRESQTLRFEQLLRICGSEFVDVNDYGCGYGALAEHLAERGIPFRYCGYDAAPEMIDAALSRHANDARCLFLSDRSAVTRRPFSVASGVFNVKQQATPSDWWAYVRDALDDLAALSEKGFAFNLLTGYSDEDRRRPDLFYASPEDVFRYCVGRFSRYVAVLHDYPLYEFTVLVRTEGAWRVS